MVPWFDRKFDFPANQNIMPSIIERLGGTAIRVWCKMERMDPSIIALRLNGKWSILDQIGHLGDLEPLWTGRLDDILRGEKVMRAADLSNTITNNADHNSRSWHELVDIFESNEALLSTNCENLNEEDGFQVVPPPSLKNSHAHPRSVHLRRRTR